jgi:L-fuconolactonase
MNKIDAHQHFWNYDKDALPWINDDMVVLRQDFMPPELKTEMDTTSFDGCVAVQAVQTEEETNFLLDLANQYDYIKGVVGWVDLQDISVKSRLSHFSKYPKMKGVRHIVQDEPDDEFLLNPDFMQGVKSLPEFDLTYDILIFEHHLPVALQFVSYLPGCRLVVDHLAKPLIAEGELTPWQQNMRSMGRYQNVYCKLSGMVTEADLENWKPDDFTAYLDVAFEAFGPEKLMLGSDWPVCKLAAEYTQVMEVFDRYLEQFSEEEKAMIYGQNAIDFYQLEV